MKSAPTAGSTTILRPPSRWQDPLRLIRDEAPEDVVRVALWTISALLLIMLVWAIFGQLDIVATAEGRLVPRTLVKIVQPAEPGVVRKLLVEEGDIVRAGQVLVHLDTTLASADKLGISNDLSMQRMQLRRLQAELSGTPMLPETGDDPQRFAQMYGQYVAHRNAFVDNLDQEKSLLVKVKFERMSAMDIVAKLEQTLPAFQQSAEAYAKLEKDGFIGGIAAADKQREAIEKHRDLDAQRSMVLALDATIVAQQKKISQLRSAYKSELQQELADIRARIAQLQPTLEKASYREGLMELRAPQDGIVKDLATTTVGAVVQPGSVLLTLVPTDEPLFADIAVKNSDIGFVQAGQHVRLKLAAYPFQRYGMLEGEVIHVSADATAGTVSSAGRNSTDATADDVTSVLAGYKARVRLDSQTLLGPSGERLQITPGMQVTAEINQGKKTALAYLLSPVQKVATEAARER